jgi:hypothetical protein
VRRRSAIHDKSRANSPIAGVPMRRI